jgi:hypothetical protein
MMMILHSHPKLTGTKKKPQRSHKSRKKSRTIVFLTKTKPEHETVQGTIESLQQEKLNHKTMALFLAPHKHPKTRRQLTNGEHFTLDNCNSGSSLSFVSINDKKKEHTPKGVVAPRRKQLPKSSIIKISPLIEAFDEFGWKDFPVILQEDDTESSGSKPLQTPLAQSRPDVLPQLPVGPTSRKSALLKTSSYSEFDEAATRCHPVTAVRPKWRQHAASKQQQKTHSVHFSSVHVREHASTVGDHDLCGHGGRLPISLDWTHAAEKIFDLDDYECFRYRGKKQRTPRGRLPKLDYSQRRFRLRHVSRYSNVELDRLEQEQQADKRAIEEQQPTSTKQLRRSRTVTKFPPH